MFFYFCPQKHLIKSSKDINNLENKIAPKCSICYSRNLKKVKFEYE